MNGDVWLGGLWGEADGLPGSLLARLLSTAPKFVWVEPVARRRRQDGVVGLWVGTAPGLADRLGEVAVAEARLFWPDGVLHLLAALGRTRWSAVWEPAESMRPDWLAPLRPDPVVGERLGPFERH